MPDAHHIPLFESRLHASDFCFYDGILADVTLNGGHFDEVLLVRWEDVVGRVLAR